MATMRFQQPSQASGLGWSLTSYPFPADEVDDRPKAVATEKLYRRHGWADSWQLAYNTGDEYPLEEESELRTMEEVRVETVNHEVALSRDRHPSAQGGRVCPEPGCGVTLPERGFGPHLAKHRRERA